MPATCSSRMMRRLDACPAVRYEGSRTCCSKQGIGPAGNRVPVGDVPAMLVNERSGFLIAAMSGLANALGARSMMATSGERCNDVRATWWKSATR